MSQKNKHPVGAKDQTPIVVPFAKPSNRKPLLKITGLSKTYVTGWTKDGSPIVVKALKNIELTIHRNEFTAIVGENGSGKSTLIHCLGSLERPDSDSCGQIHYYDDRGVPHNVWESSSWYRQNFVGIIFQAFHLLPNLNVLQNVALPLQFKQCQEYSPDQEIRHDKAHSAIAKLGLQGKDNSGIYEISGGQMQRAAIARAIVKKPPLLLADEPTGNLDKKTKESIVAELRALVDGGVSVLMVTHDEDYIKGIADRVIRLSDGVVVSDEYYEVSKTKWTEKKAVEPALETKPNRPDDRNPPAVDHSCSGNASIGKEPVALVTKKTLSKEGFSSPCDAPVPPTQNSPSGKASLDEPNEGNPTSSKVANVLERSKEIVPSSHKSSEPIVAIPCPVLQVANEAALATGHPPSENNLHHGPIAHSRPTRRHLFAQGIPDLIRLATKDALESKVSLFSNVAAILFGTILTGILVSLLLGMHNLIDNLVPTIPGIDSVRIAVDYSTGAQPLTKAEFMKFGQLPDVVTAIPNIQTFAIVYDKKDRETIISISSASTNDPDLKKLTLLAGHAEINPEAWEIIVPENVAEEINNFNPLGITNKDLTLVLRRYKQNGNGGEPEVVKALSYPVRVVGIVKDTPKHVCYGSLNMVRFTRDFLTGRSDSAPEPGKPVDISTISAKTMFEGVRVHFKRPALAENAYNIMHRDRSSRMDVFWPGSEIEYLRDVELLAAIILLGIGLLATISGSISIFNTLMASVARKSRDFGILRALGANPADVFLIVLWQAILMGILAGVLGLLLCCGTDLILNRLIITQWPELGETLTKAAVSGLFVLPFSVMILIFAAVLAICALSGLLPSWRASQRTPMDALRTLQ